MAFLCRFTLFLIVLWTIAIGSVRLVDRTWQLPMSVLFTYPDGQPCPGRCMFGIRPGKTTYSQALSLLKSHPFTHNFVLMDKWILTSPDWTLNLTLNTNDILTEIDLTRDARASMSSWGCFGEVVALLGPPDQLAIVREFRGEFVQSYYLANMLAFSHRSLSSEAIVLEDQFSSVRLLTPTFLPDLSVWHGFSNRSDLYKVISEVP